MQALRDAAILLGLLIVLSSVRVSRVEPGPAALDLVPPAHAGVPASLDGGMPAATPDGPLAPPAEAADACSTRALRVEAVEVKTIELGTGVVEVTVDTRRAESRPPRACKIG